MRPFFNTILLTLACAAASSAGAAEFLPMPGAAQFRGAALDATSGHLLLSAYDQDEVWAVDPATGTRVWSVATGRGPAAVAVNSSGTAAVAARLDGTITLFDAGTGADRGEVSLGEGATDLAAAGGGFLAISAFTDSVYYIGAAATGATLTKVGTIPVPSRVAAGVDYAFVVSTAPHALHILDVSGALPRAAGNIALDAAVRDIAALPGGRVAVLDASGIAVYDGQSRNRLFRRTRSGTALSSDGDALYLLAQGAVEKLDSAANPVESIALGDPARLLHASGGLVAALDPARRGWSLYNPGGIAALPAAAPVLESAPVPPAPSVPPGAPEEFRMEEAPTLEAETPAPEAVSESVPEAEPVVEPIAEAAPLPKPQPVVEDTPPMVAPATKVAEVAPVAEVSVAEDAPARVPVRPGATMHTGGLAMPTFYGGPRAPHPGEPSAVPFSQFDQQSIADALQQPAIFTEEGTGFQMLDWSQPLTADDITSDDFSIEGNSFTAGGNVRFTIGDIQFQSDRLTYREEPLLIFAEGNVRVEQGEAFLTADVLRFEATEPPAEEVAEHGEGEAEEEEPPIFGENGEEEGQPAEGIVFASNIHIVEPGREITATQLDYDFAAETGHFEDVTGWAGIYYFHADSLDIHGRRSFDGNDVWITTCDRDPPHYRIRLRKVAVAEGRVTSGTSARLQFGTTDTPVFLPQWRHGGGGKYPWTLDFDSGRQADIGYYVNLGQRYEIDPDVGLGPRLFITEKEGVGLGADLDYDFTERPASRLFRSKGEAHVLRTTEDDGLAEWYHRYEYSPDLTVRMQAEHWDDRDFYKDFYYDTYRHRTGPRTFANVTLRKDAYIATASASATTHGWVSGTEKLPELTFHLIERPLAGKLRFSFDTINGYYNAEPRGARAARSVSVARLSYDWDITEAFNVTPFAEAEAAWYSRERFDDDSSARLSGVVGVTAQTRFHRIYGGRWGFSGFKHIVVPSVTYSYRPDSSISLAETPRFDALDKSFGRSRIESKIDNVVYGRDGETGAVWQVGRLSLYSGNDFASEVKKTHDYEIEIDIRPRPWWGLQFVGERHITGEDEGLEWFGRVISRGYENIFDRTPPWAEDFDYNSEYGDFSRTLSQIYYDDTINGGRFKGRLGFAYTRTREETFNREIHYGLGYRLGDKWGIGIEHIYDIEEGDLRTQTYEVRRSLHEWEAAFRVRSRESGVDLNLEFNIKAFPGSSVKL